jgi:hypothetical protein
MSALDRLDLWKRYRTFVVPACLIVALLSIIFGGSLVAEQSLTERAPHSFNRALLGNLGGATLIMLMHATYLTLMAFHLVYRFPIEEVQTVGISLVPIAIAYLFHAGSEYKEATGGEGSALLAAWSSACFATTYMLVAGHGLRERFEPHPEEHHFVHRTEKTRSTWMLGTDIAMCAVTVFMLLTALEWLPAVVVAREHAIGASFDSQFNIFGLPLGRLGTPKDALIALALLFLWLARWRDRKTLRQDQAERNANVLQNQTLEPMDPTSVQTLCTGLPPQAVWLDVGSAQGHQVTELLDMLYASSPSHFPTEVVFLDRDASALAGTEATKPVWWPSTTRRTQRHADVGDDCALAALSSCSVIHMSHLAYSLETAKRLLAFLEHARVGHHLLLRFTSGASFYRAISASTSCAPLRPYFYHAVHPFLCEDLKRAGWELQHRTAVVRHYDIASNSARRHLVDWCDCEYGEFSGDVIERYLKGFHLSGRKTVLNSDWLLWFQKRAVATSAASRAPLI